MRKLLRLSAAWVAIGLLLGLGSLSQNHLVAFVLRGFTIAVLLPGFMAGGAFLTMAQLLTPWGIFLAGALQLLLSSLLLLALRGRSRLPAAQQEAVLTRRAFLAAGASCGASTVVLGYGFTRGRAELELTQQAVSLPGLPGSLDGLRVAMMADWHRGPHNSVDFLRQAVDLCNQARPDLILLPGDFLSYSGKYAGDVGELISLLRPGIPDGVFASWGNHDYWSGMKDLPGALRASRARLLTNESLCLNARREISEGGRGLYIVGLDDLWAGKPDLEKGLRGIPNDQPRLVMCHNPDVAELQREGRVDLMISGHTHGGQIRLPGLGAPVIPSNFGQKYAEGLVQGPAYPVFVTRGVGVGGVPVRLGVPPEVVLFTLHAS